VLSVHTLAGEGDLGKLIGKLVMSIGGSVVVLLTENAVSVTITAQVFDDRKFRNRQGREPATRTVTPLIADELIWVSCWSDFPR
jgi:hypothetical protein